MIWDYLEESEQTTRGDAMEVFADILLALLEKESNEIDHTNGFVCDALEAAINHLDRGEEVAELLRCGMKKRIEALWWNR